MIQNRLWKGSLIVVLIVAVGSSTAQALFGQSQQIVEVTIKNFQFVTKQPALRLGLPTIIRIRNEDGERHDFGSAMFDGIPAQIEMEGVIAYGQGLHGVYLDSKRDVTVRFEMSRPGRHEFRCSIHPNMKGEFLLLTVEAA